MAKRTLAFTFAVILLTGLLLFLQEEETRALVATPHELDALWAAVRVVEDSEGVPHIFAQNDHDGNFMVGYLHARDRLFQMDHSRRFFSGTLAELLGQTAVDSDVTLRNLGMRRAAEDSWAAYSPQSQALLQAYSDDINAFLAEQNPLPPEYTALELTSIPDWTTIDTLTVVKGLTLSLSFDLDDISRSLTLAEYIAAGEAGNFDGKALFFEDT